MNSNCRQTLAALLEGKERISQSIYMNERIRIIWCIKFSKFSGCVYEQHSKIEYKCHKHELKLVIIEWLWWLGNKNVDTINSSSFLQYSLFVCILVQEWNFQIYIVLQNHVFVWKLEIKITKFKPFCVPRNYQGSILN